MSELQQSPAVPTICPSCARQVAAIQPDRSTHFVCEHCGAYFVDAWDEEKLTLASFSNELHRDMSLKPGAAGTLLGSKYVVAGAMRRIERSDPAVSWMEYVLYGERDSGAVLVEFEGTWLLVRPATEIPKKSAGDELSYNLGVYRPFHDYAVDIVGAAGSFDYNILDDQQLYTWEYENGTRRLIYESRGGTDGDWYVGLPLDTGMVGEGFRIPGGVLPTPDRYPRRPPAEDNPFAPQLPRLYTIAVIAVVVVGALQLGVNQFHPSSNLLDAEYTTGTDSLPGAATRPIVSEPFKVPSRSSLTVDLRAPVNNSWLEVNAVMVNDKTGQVFESAKSIEEYHGYEGGESWQEGGETSEIQFSSVPPGTYHLNITTTADQSSATSGMPLRVQVRHSNWVLSNFVLILLLIIAFPVIVSMRSNHYNQNH